MLYNTLRQYEYIVAVAEARSLTDAAAALNVSQPSLSVAISRVEQRLGKRLFVRRKGAPIQITPFGHQFIAEARDVLERALMLEQAHGRAAPFVLGCSEDIAPWHLAPALGRLEARFPDLTFQIREGRFSDLAADLAEGRADIVISYDVGFEGPFERRGLKTIRPVVFCALDHPLAGRPSVALEELVDHPIILFSEDLSEGFVRNLFEERRLPATVKQRVASLEMMRSLAAHGGGVGISYTCPPGDVSYDGKRLATVPISTPGASAQIALLWSSLRTQDPEFLKIVEHLAAPGDLA